MFLVYFHGIVLSLSCKTPGVLNDIHRVGEDVWRSFQSYGHTRAECLQPRALGHGQEEAEGGALMGTEVFTKKLF